MSIELRQLQGGTRLPVRVRAGGRRNAVLGVRDGALRVEVTQAPEKGKANAAVAGLLASHFGLARSSVQLSSGAASSRKCFLLRGIDPAVAAKKIAALDDSKGDEAPPTK